jgi:hypothetical protein
VSRLHLSFRLALAISLLALLGVVAAATTVGYLVEAHNQHTDRHRRIAAAAAYVDHGKAQAETKRWQKALAGKLAELGLRAELVHKQRERSPRWPRSWKASR